MRHQLLALDFLFLTCQGNGEVCKCQVKTDREVTVPDCGQGFPNKRSLLAKGKTASSILINQNSRGEILTATPNPFNNFLTVSLQGEIKNSDSKASYSLSVVDADGKTISTKSINGSENLLRFNTTSYASGMYLLILKSTDGLTQATKVVKIK